MTFITYYWHFDKLVDSRNVCVCMYVYMYVLYMYVCIYVCTYICMDYTLGLVFSKGAGIVSHLIQSSSS
jgi:hypothetical protein